MLSQETLRQLLTDVTAALREVFGDRLENVILYGSYARGDADDESDVDVMALVRDIPRDELWRYWDDLCNHTSDLGLQYDVVVSVMTEDTQTFIKYADAMPFLQNVIREGISLVQDRVC